jgi:ATP/ADP translocase
MKMLTSFLKPIFEIRPEERFKTFLMLLYFFFTIALIYILKPVRGALFLGELGAQNLRYVYMGEGIFLIFVVAAYVFLSKRMPKKVFFTTILLFFASNLVLFWFLFHAHVPFLSAVFYIWVASFSITMTTQFWIMANDIFKPHEAKRLFGLIISGGSAGGVVGGLMTQRLAYVMRTEDLLLVAAGIVIVCVVINWIAWKKIPEASAMANVSARTQAQTASSPLGADSSTTHHSSRKLLMGSSYLIMLALIVLITKMSSTIVDNQFNRVVELTIQTKEARTAFLGGFMAWLNALSFFMQLFVTSLCLRYIGIGFSLIILPLGMGAFSFMSLLYPVLGMGLALKMYDGSISYSVQQASKEVLFLPLSSELRYRIKPVIDMLGFRGAKTFAGLYIALCAPLFGLSDEHLGALILILIPFWLYLVWNMRKAYSRLLRDHLLKRRPYDRAITPQRAMDVMSFLHDEKGFNQIQSLMDHPSPFNRKAAVTACLAYARSQNLEDTRKLVEKMIREDADHDEKSENGKPNLQFEDFQFLSEDLGLRNLGHIFQKGNEPLVLEHSPAILNRVETILNQEQNSPQAKRRAVRLLAFIPTQKAVHIALRQLTHSQDHSYRFLLAKTLNRIHEQNPMLQLSRGSLRSEIVRETKIFKTLQKLLAFHETQTLSQNKKYITIALQALREESFERLFYYLDLLYPHEIIQEIYQNLMDPASSNPSRQHAIELLSNTLEPDVLIAVSGVLESQIEIPDDDEIESLCESLIHSGDRWFGIIGQFLVSELKFKHPVRNGAL